MGGHHLLPPPRVSDPGGELSLKISSPPAGWGGTTCLKEEMFWGGTKSVRFLASKSYRNTRYGAEKAATVWRACGAKILCFPARNTQFFSSASGGVNSPPNISSLAISVPNSAHPHSGGELPPQGSESWGGRLPPQPSEIWGATFWHTPTVGVYRDL